MSPGAGLESAIQFLGYSNLQYHGQVFSPIVGLTRCILWDA